MAGSVGAVGSSFTLSDTSAVVAPLEWPRFAVRSKRVQTVEQWKHENLKAITIMRAAGVGFIVLGIVFAVVEVIG